MTVLEHRYSLLEVLGFSLFNRQLVHEVGVGMRFEWVRVIGQSLLEFRVGVVGESLLEGRWNNPLLFHSFRDNHYYNYTNLTTVIRACDKGCYVDFLVREGLRSVLLLGYLSSVWEEVSNLVHLFGFARIFPLELTVFV